MDSKFQMEPRKIKSRTTAMQDFNICVSAARPALVNVSRVHGGPVNASPNMMKQPLRRKRGQSISIETSQHNKWAISCCLYSNEPWLRARLWGGRQHARRLNGNASRHRFLPSPPRVCAVCCYIPNSGFYVVGTRQSK